MALFDASNNYHHKAIEFIRNNRYALVTTIASLTETMHLLDFNRNAQLDFIQWVINGAIIIEDIQSEELIRIKQLIDKYQNLSMDFAAACLVYLAEKLEVDTVATIDRDFTIYKIQGHKKFKMAIT